MSSAHSGCAVSTAENTESAAARTSTCPADDGYPRSAAGATAGEPGVSYHVTRACPRTASRAIWSLPKSDFDVSDEIALLIFLRASSGFPDDNPSTVIWLYALLTWSFEPKSIVHLPASPCLSFF